VGGEKRSIGGAGVDDEKPVRVLVHRSRVGYLTPISHIQRACGA
jgi:hypothetical protein